MRYHLRQQKVKPLLDSLALMGRAARAFAGYPELLAKLPEKAGAVEALALGVSKLAVLSGKRIIRQGAFAGEHEVRPGTVGRSVRSHRQAEVAAQ